MNLFPLITQAYSGSLVSNVIFPAFMTPYITLLLAPFWGLWLLLSEWGMLLWLEAHKAEHHGRWKLLWYVLSANIVSSFIGIGLSYLLPSGLQPHEYTYTSGEIVHTFRRSERWGWYALVSFILAYGLSILIEGFVLKQRGRYGISRSWRKAFFFNTVSYGGFFLFALFIEFFR